MGAEVLFIFQAISAIKGFIDQRKAAKETKKANAASMAESERQARLTREEGEEQARQERLDAKRVRSAQMASFLQSGVTLDGSPLLVTNETRDAGQDNSDAILKNSTEQAETLLLQGKANQKPVQKADIFGTAATVFGAGKDSGVFNKKG